MTRRQQILAMMEKLPDDVSYDQAIYHLSVMKDIEIGLEQAERGEVCDHEEVFRELLQENVL